jgi:hypothetical protein
MNEEQPQIPDQRDISETRLPSRKSLLKNEQGQAGIPLEAGLLSMALRDCLVMGQMSLSDEVS